MEEDMKPTEETKLIDDGDVKLLEEKRHAKLSSEKRAFSKTILFIILTLILVASAAGASYWWRDKIATEFEKDQATEISSLQKTIVDIEKKLISEKAETPGTGTSVETDDDDTACEPVAPAYSVLENIQASITSGNTQALEGYMAASVNVILAATEAYGPQTPTQAVTDITSFITGETDWDFTLPASVLSSYGKGGYGEYFTNIDVVGKSADGKVISFLFDCNADISTVFLSSGEDLLE